MKDLSFIENNYSSADNTLTSKQIEQTFMSTKSRTGEKKVAELKHEMQAIDIIKSEI